MMWTDKAFKIFMGNAMAQEPEGRRHWDVMFANAVRDQSLEAAAACETAVEARRAGSSAGSPAMAGHSQMVRGTQG